MPEQPKQNPGAVPATKLVRIGGILTGIVLTALVLWLILDDSGSDSTSDSEGGAEIVTAADLRDEAVEQEYPIYWAGAQPGTELELSQREGGRTYVRYLTGDAEAGDPRPDFLTVGSYVAPYAAADLRRQSKVVGYPLLKAPGNGIVYFNRAAPSSVYLAYPGVEVQIEVYDPSFKRALQLVTSGQIAPVS